MTISSLVQRRGNAQSRGRALLLGSALLALSACDKPIDFDMRGLTDAFSTAPAANEAKTAAKPVPNAQGVISYPNYQVVVAKRGDTIGSVAARVGLPVTELARYNGIPVDVTLRPGEVIALPRRIGDGQSTVTPTGTIATGERIDIAALADEAITDAETKTTTTPIAQSNPSEPVAGMEPIRHQVQRGETAYSIARKYGVSVRALADWNGLGSDLAVTEGRYLLIPVKTSEGVSETAITTEPGKGSVTPTPPSAAAPCPIQTWPNRPQRPPNRPPTLARHRRQTQRWPNRSPARSSAITTRPNRNSSCFPPPQARR